MLSFKVEACAPGYWLSHTTGRYGRRPGLPELDGLAARRRPMKPEQAACPGV